MMQNKWKRIRKKCGIEDLGGPVYLTTATEEPASETNEEAISAIRTCIDDPERVGDLINMI